MRDGSIQSPLLIRKGFRKGGSRSTVLEKFYKIPPLAFGGIQSGLQLCWALLRGPQL